MNKIFVVGIFLLVFVGVFWFYSILRSQKNFVSQGVSSSSINLDFFVGGSINGPTFKITVKDAHITYQEFVREDKKNPVKQIERVLSQEEVDILIKTLQKADIIHLQSQDFESGPFITDQGRYSVSLVLGGLKNTIECSIPPDPSVISSLTSTKTLECQRRIKMLQETFNVMLGVHIY